MPPDTAGSAGQDRIRGSAATVLAETLPVLRRAAKHYDCEDCWYSCATLTCDDGRRSNKCDCGAAEALRVLRQVEAVLA